MMNLTMDGSAVTIGCQPLNPWSPTEHSIDSGTVFVVDQSMECVSTSTPPKPIDTPLVPTLELFNELLKALLVIFYTRINVQVSN